MAPRMSPRLLLAVALLGPACGHDRGPPAAPGGAAGEGGGDQPDAGSGGRAGTSGGAGGGAGMSTPDAAQPETIPPAVDAEASDTSAPDATATAAPRCPPGPYEAPKVGARKDICAGFQVKYNWNEGPTWVASQKAFFFSNFVMMQPGPGDMIKYDPATDKCEVFIAGNGCNGLAVDGEGNIIAVCQTPRALLKFDLATKQSTVLVDMVDGQKLDSPNDLAIHANGTIYFSNTTFELGGRPQGLGPALLRFDPSGMVHLVAKGGINPLGLSPDQKRLYAMGGWWDLDDQGVPVKKNGGFTLGNDGITLDCAGNVYTASGTIVSPQNQQIGRFAGGTNAAFGGEDGKTLLVVGGRNMHTVQMNLPGLPY
jgi:gluconolactonase